MKGPSQCLRIHKTVQCSRQNVYPQKHKVAFSYMGLQWHPMSLMVSCFIESNEILNVQTRTISCFGNRIVRWEGSDLVRKKCDHYNK